MEAEGAVWAARGPTAEAANTILNAVYKKKRNWDMSLQAALGSRFMLEKFANLVCEILEIGESQWKVHGSA